MVTDHQLQEQHLGVFGVERGEPGQLVVGGHAHRLLQGGALLGRRAGVLPGVRVDRVARSRVPTALLHPGHERDVGGARDVVRAQPGQEHALLLGLALDHVEREGVDVRVVGGVAHQERHRHGLLVVHQHVAGEADLGRGVGRTGAGPRHPHQQEHEGDRQREGQHRHEHLPAARGVRLRRSGRGVVGVAGGPDGQVGAGGRHPSSIAPVPRPQTGPEVLTARR